MGKLIKILISFGITAVLLWLVLKDINWQEFGAEASTVNYFAIIPALTLMIAHYYIRSYRWRFLLAEGERVKLQTLFDAIMIGNFGTYLLPLRAGEFMRPFMLSYKAKKDKEANISFSTAFGSVVIERFFDLASVLLSFGLLLNYIDSFSPAVYSGAKALCVLASGIFIFIGCCLLLPTFVINTAKQVFGIFPEKLTKFALKFITDFIESAAPLKNPKRLLMVASLSIVVWLSVFGIFYLFFYLTPNVTPSFLFSVTISVIIALLVAAPSAPGFIGVYQTGCLISFSLFGFTKESALVYALISHLLHYAIFLLYGFYLVSREGLSVRELMARGGEG